MKISVETIDIANSGLHDYEVVNISVDYKGATVSIQMKDGSGIEVLMKISQTEFVRLTNDKPWGEGNYVCSSSIDEKNDGKKVFEIQLNSGDELSIQYSGDIYI